jgi:hypothetical protein
VSRVVTGTRERLYRVETASDVSVWVDDEIDAMGQGWMPLASEVSDDGSLRVIYGKLPDELEDEDPSTRTVPAGSEMKAAHARSVMSFAVLCAIALGAVAVLSLLAGPF